MSKSIAPLTIEVKQPNGNVVFGYYSGGQGVSFPRSLELISHAESALAEGMAYLSHLKEILKQETAQSTA